MNKCKDLVTDILTEKPKTRDSDVLLFQEVWKQQAEKEIGNKEWNERTAKKLDMLKSLNAAGKFKKDWDEEKLQGWVDQNYSWEKLSRQFKLNESY